MNKLMIFVFSVLRLIDFINLVIEGVIAINWSESAIGNQEINLFN